MKFKTATRLVAMVAALTLVAGIATLTLSLSTGTASAAAPNPPNCMAKDMSLWAREGSGFFDFTSGAGWGGFVAQNAQAPSPFGQDNFGHAMTAHLAGDFFGLPGITCQPPA